MLRADDIVIGTKGVIFTVERELGSGGQGSVYLASDQSGTNVAVKWYAPNFQTARLRQAITDIVAMPRPSRHFLWPDDLVTAGNEFGYVMQLRPPQYFNVPRLLKRKVSIRFAELMCAANQTVSAFKALQSRGLFYCDISDGNLFFDPATGDVLICDNDNVGSPGRVAPVLGTPRYMAPEIVRGEDGPSPLTDSFSMAVLLFLLLFNGHPLEGAAASRIRCLDGAAMRQLYGTRPVFIFDSQDRSNRPVPGLHDNASTFWAIYPQILRNVFTKAFTAGLRSPGDRPAFSEWQEALAQAEDVIVQCSCGKQTFFEVSGVRPPRCWACRSEVPVPMRLVIGARHTVLLNKATKLYKHHLTPRGGDPGDRGPSVAQVIKHPTADLWGLQNLTQQQWFVKRPDGSASGVPPGKSVSLAEGAELNFGDAKATIEPQIPAGATVR